MRHETAIAATGGTAPETTVYIAGTWTNELGSTVTFAQAGAALSGMYRSAVSGDGDPVTGPVTGWVSGRQVGFTVVWPGGTITAWIGHVLTSPTGSRIETLWHLAEVTADRDDPANLWDTILAGADEFVASATTSTPAT